MITALDMLAPGVGTTALALLQSPQPPPIEHILTSVLNAFSAAYAVPPVRDVALVLDDYHVITAPAIHGALALLLDYLPPQLHLVILTRADPALPLARLRARGVVTELHARDLRFTPDEGCGVSQSGDGAVADRCRPGRIGSTYRGLDRRAAAGGAGDARPPGSQRLHPQLYRQQPLYRGLPGRRGVRVPAGPSPDLLAAYRHPRPDVRPAV